MMKQIDVRLKFLAQQEYKPYEKYRRNSKISKLNYGDNSTLEDGKPTNQLNYLLYNEPRCKSSQSAKKKQAKP